MTQVELQSKVYRVAPATRRFSYLTAPDGDWLAVVDGQTTIQRFVDDQALWVEAGDGFRHAESGLLLAASPGEQPGAVRLSLGGEAPDRRYLGADGAPGAAAGFTVGLGPEKRPSEYMAEFQAQGWVALTQILPPAVLEGLQRLAGTDAFEGPGEERMQQLALGPALARATVEPVSLWLCREYMRTPDIKLGHPPSVTALTPDDGARPVQGWHSDFPYMWGSERARRAYRVPPGSDELCLAIQRNICVSDFRVDNGATVFKLGSHAAGQIAPEPWGRARDTYRPEHRAEHGLPYAGPETDIIEAPAGTILLYDARTWHRAGVNTTNRRRGAVIQAITPGFIIPFYPLGPPYKGFLESDVPAQLTERERREIEALMVHRITGPMGVFAIGVDDALTERIRNPQAPSAAY